MSPGRRLGIIVTTIPLVLLLWASVVFAMDRASNSGEVLGNVGVGDLELGGLTEAEARVALQELEERLIDQPVFVDVVGQEYRLPPAAVGLRLDIEAMLADAMDVGRTGDVPDQFRWWLSHFGESRRNLDLVVMYDREALEPFFDRWERDAIADPPFEGGISIIDGRAVPEYPRQGTGVERDIAADMIFSELSRLERSPVVVPTRRTLPTLTQTDLNSAVDEANSLIGSSVELSSSEHGTSITFPAAVLAEAFSATVSADEGERATISMAFSTARLSEHVDTIRSDLEFEPTNAQINITPDDRVEITPSTIGVVIDDPSLPEAVMTAATSITRSAALPYRPGAQPSFSTADAEAMGIKEKISEFTTNFPAGGDEINRNRTNNIHRIADETDGTFVLNGEIFSLNETVGERTLADGYLPAYAIINGDLYCCDHPANVGGGTSQFATTIYNAAFFAGLKDIEHFPHTLYFSKYPEGREATLGFPSPDVKFLNNTGNALVIKTSYTDSSVTVKIFGDNGGIDVEAGLSERRDFTDPETLYVPDPDLRPGQERLESRGAQGWTVTIYRYITRPDGTKTTEEWVWRYRPFFEKIAVHPCELPPDHAEYVNGCPRQVPDVRGKNAGGATNALSGAGLNIAFGDPTTVSSEDRDGKVQSQSISPGTWVNPGTTVTVSLGAYTPPDDGGGGGGGSGGGGGGGSGGGGGGGDDGEGG